MSDTKDSPAPASKQVYLVDTDVLALIEGRPDAAHIYDGLIAMAGTRVRSIRQVFDELKRFPKAYEILKPHREVFQIPIVEQYYPAVAQLIEILGNELPDLWKQTGGKNPDPADPWLVAIASAYDYTVVTNEKQNSPFKIPAACDLPKIKCRCISGPHFLIEVGLAQLRPEDISPHAFFNPKKSV